MNSPLVQAVSWALVNLVWQGVLVAGVLGLALRIVPGRRAGIRYVLACGALVVMVMLPLVGTAQRYSASAVAAGVPLLAGVPAHVVLAAPDAAPSAVPVAEPRAQLVRVGEFFERHARWVVLAWGLGVLWGSARILSGWRRVTRLCGQAEPAGPEIQAALDRLCAALGIRRAVRLLASGDVVVPATVGWLRPVVLMPVAVLSGLSAAELELVLRHELAHVRRHDYLVNLVQTAAETLLFFHPAVWWIGSVIRSERENCCDDLALASGAAPLSYARALTALETLRVLPAPALSALGGSLPQRIRRLVLPGERSRKSWSAGASIVPVFSGLAVAVPLAATALTCKAAGEPHEAEPVEEYEAEPVEYEYEAASEPIEYEAEVEPVEEIEFEAERGDEIDDEEASPPRLSVDDLVALSTAGVTGEYVDAMTALFGELAVQELVQLRVLGVTREYVEALFAAGFRDLEPDAVANARALGLDGRYAKDLRAEGVRGLDWDELLGLRALGVTPEWIRAMRKAGLRDLSAEEMSALRGMGVDAEYVRDLFDAGLSGLSVDDLLKLRAAGITREFLERIAGPRRERKEKS